MYISCGFCIKQCFQLSVAAWCMHSASCSICTSLVGPCHSPAYSNNVTSSKWADTLICHTRMHRNAINFLNNPVHVTLRYVKVDPVANTREGSAQVHDWVRVIAQARRWIRHPFELLLVAIQMDARYTYMHEWKHFIPSSLSWCDTDMRTHMSIYTYMHIWKYGFICKHDKTQWIIS